MVRACKAKKTPDYASIVILEKVLSCIGTLSYAASE
jgi:hypothetical protein